MPASRASLSCDPKCTIAKSLTGMGVRLIAVSPTAITGAPSGPVIAAASSATPSATAAVIMPASAPASRRRTVGWPDVVITGPIRNCRHSQIGTEINRAYPPAHSGTHGCWSVGILANPEAARPRMRRHEQARDTAADGQIPPPRRGTSDRIWPCCLPGWRAATTGVRAGLRRTCRAGIRHGPAGAARSRPVRGGRPGGPARGLADRVPVRPGQGQRGRLGPDHRAPPRGRPGPVGERLLAPEQKAALDLPTEGDDVAEIVEASLDRQRVRRCLDGLTELQRESIKLAYYGGYSYPQVAQLLDVALGTVKTRIRDGLIRMRDCMEVKW